MKKTQSTESSTSSASSDFTKSQVSQAELLSEYNRILALIDEKERQLRALSDSTNETEDFTGNETDSDDDDDCFLEDSLRCDAGKARTSQRAIRRRNQRRAMRRNRH